MDTRIIRDNEHRGEDFKCSPRTSYLVHGLERLLYQAGGGEASRSPWSERWHYETMADKIYAIQ